MAQHQRDSYQTGFEMDESFKGNRWTSNHEDNQNVFLKYAGGSYSKQQNMETIRSVGESNRRNHTEFSQVSNQNAFRKVKYNQIETLKELRQEYEILRNLPIQDQFIQHSHMKRQSNSLYNSQAGRDSSSVTSSSKPSHKSKRHTEHHVSRDAQILTLEKKQLQLVIGNSMRKIEQLLNSEIEYKKTIHELQNQLDSKSFDDKIESMSRTMKKNENELNEKIGSLQRQIEKLTFSNKQLSDRNSQMEGQINSNNQEFRRYREEKRNLEDSLRLQKDKYSSLELDLKRQKMESEITEKDLKNQIQRLHKISGLFSQKEKRDLQSTISRLEEELRGKERSYQTLYNEFERYKNDSSNKEPNNNANNDQYKIMETLLGHLKDESANQNRASMDLLASMMGKMQKKTTPERKDKTFEEQYHQLSSENYQLKLEIAELRRQRASSPKANPPNILEGLGFAQKIKELEREIADGSISRQNLMKEYEIIKSSYQYTKQQYSKLNDEFQRLRAEKAQAPPPSNYSHEEERARLREIEGRYQEENRNLRRRLDEALFLVDKTRKEAEFNLNLVRVQHESNIKVFREDIRRLQGERNNLRMELDKMKNFYQAKLQEKNALLEKSTLQYTETCESNERALIAYKAQSEREMAELLKKIEASAELNERYLNLSNRYSSTERELDELRYAIKKLKGMNDGVDHLWQVKETEYHNLNELMQDLRAH